MIEMDISRTEISKDRDRWRQRPSDKYSGGPSIDGYGSPVAERRMLHRVFEPSGDSFTNRKSSDTRGRDP